MTQLFFEAERLLREGKNMVIARIIRLEGSGPRGAGTRCIVLENDEILGTIGGGLMEHLVIQKAGDVFKTKQSAVLRLDLTGRDVSKSDMICGGTVDIHLEPVFADNPEAMPLVMAINRLIHEGRSGILVTCIEEGIGSDDPACRAVIDQGGHVAGRVGPFEPQDVAAFLHAKEDVQLIKAPGEGRYFIEKIVPQDVLYIFGAGHISTFLARLSKMIGFKVIVIDDREDFANRDRFPEVDDIWVAQFTQVFEKFEAISASYMVIVTRGHIHDMGVLREGLRARPGYIGMIGSRRKRDQIYSALMKEGFTNEQLASVHCPIGLDIGAQTPEEIAVSIAAELIAVRNRRTETRRVGFKVASNRT